MLKRDENQDIESRLRDLTERTRRTRRELEDLIRRSNRDRTRGMANDAAPFFRRRRSRPEGDG